MTSEVLINNTCVGEFSPAPSDDLSAWSDIGYDGRGKRIVVGPRHPRRAEWEREYDELAEWVLTGRKQPTTTRDDATSERVACVLG